MKQLDGIVDSMDMSLSKLWETVKVREVWYPAVHRVAKSWTRLNVEQQLAKQLLRSWVISRIISSSEILS